MNSTRPSPTESATWYEAGSCKRGNDGNLYIISITNSGIHRWIPAGSGCVETEIRSFKHPQYKNQSPSTNNHNYKFNVGDEVKITNYGWGCAPHELNKIVHIIAQGDYHGNPGYKVSPELGNMLSPTYDFIGENSFKLVKPIINKSINTQIKPKMAKTKSITKKTTQEVRSIETSLINKEEVFKMLALAESTGLPLLLVGDPGVNSK